MADYTITINTDNAAFGESTEGDEVGRILRQLSDDAENGKLGQPGGITLWDANGNHVGQCRAE